MMEPQPLPRPERYRRDPKLTATGIDDNDVYVDVCLAGLTDVYFRHSSCDISARHNAAREVRTFCTKGMWNRQELGNLQRAFYL